MLKDPNILPENVYNLDETGVTLCMLGSFKVLLSSDDLRDYRSAGVKRTIVTAIEYISAHGRSLLLMIIWPATTHCSNWTTSGENSTTLGISNKSKILCSVSSLSASFTKFLLAATNPILTQSDTYITTRVGPQDHSSIVTTSSTPRPCVWIAAGGLAGGTLSCPI